MFNLKLQDLFYLPFLCLVVALFGGFFGFVLGFLLGFFYCCCFGVFLNNTFYIMNIFFEDSRVEAFVFIMKPEIFFDFLNGRNNNI